MIGEGSGLWPLDDSFFLFRGVSPLFQDGKDDSYERLEGFDPVV